MTSDLDSGGESPTESRRRHAFRIHLWVATGCYLLASFALYQWGHGTNPWRLVWAVLPPLSMAWMVIVIALRVRQMDEYQVKLFFPGLAVGFAAAILAAATLGALSTAGFAVPNGGWPVVIIGIVAWEFANRLTRAPKA